MEYEAYQAELKKAKEKIQRLEAENEKLKAALDSKGILQHVKLADVVVEKDKEIKRLRELLGGLIDTARNFIRANHLSSAWDEYFEQLDFYEQYEEIEQVLEDRHE